MNLSKCLAISSWISFVQKSVNGGESSAALGRDLAAVAVASDFLNPNLLRNSRAAKEWKLKCNPVVTAAVNTCISAANRGRLPHGPLVERISAVVILTRCQSPSTGYRSIKIIDISNGSKLLAQAK